MEKFNNYRNQVEELISSDHRLFIKSLISIEYGIEDEKKLDDLYDTWMRTDDAQLLSDVIDEHVKDVECY